MAIGLYLAGMLEPGQSASVCGIFEFIINIADDDIVLFDNYKSEKLTKLLVNIKKCKVVKVDISGCNDWKDVKAYQSQLLKEHNVETFIFTKLNILDTYCRKNSSLVEMFMRKLKQQRYDCYWKYNSWKNIFVRFMFVLSASKICENVYHYVVDPKELLFDDFIKFKHFERLYYLNRPDGKYRFVPALEYKLCNMDIESDNKVIDFTFYCTAFAPERQFIADVKSKIEAIPKWDVNVATSAAVKIEEKRNPKTSNQFEYYQKLANSRYTAIIQSYDKTTFSSWRFFEALVVDCLPFVFNNCCLDDCRITFPNIYNIINEHLIVDGFKEIKHRIKDWSEEYRQEIIDELKATKEWKALRNIKFYKKRWSEVQGFKIKEVT